MQRKSLIVVFFINAAMFVVELVSGLMAHSLSLLSDSLDMLTDALVYGLSLHVLSLGPIYKARAALVKAAVMAGTGVFVFAQVVHRALHPELPAATTMTAVGLAALAANATCFYLLFQHRERDVNMKSVWLCSRNDLMANGLVLLAAGGVTLTASAWPDMLVGCIIGAIFVRSAFAVGVEAYAELRRHSGRWTRSAVSTASAVSPPRRDVHRQWP